MEALKSRSPVVLRGSRGVGKSFLLRVAEAEMIRDFRESHLLSVYVTFARASLIRTPTPERFLQWMIAKLCNRIMRAATSAGLVLPGGSAILSIRVGNESSPSKMEQAEKIFEESWRSKSVDGSTHAMPEPDVMHDAVEDLCRTAGVRRVVLLIDEAAHVFILEQQRKFFTLMRDLRSPYIAVKAAVYPGVTAFGEIFQPSHDATTLSVDRSVIDDEFSRSMREIVIKQDSSMKKIIIQNGDVFDTLAFAATGNPGILLKTLARATPFSAKTIQEVIRGYYREEIWGEYSSLTERYPGHRVLIDWGRKFIEGDVLPDLYRRNQVRD